MNERERTMLTLLVPVSDKSMLEQLGELMFGESNMSAVVRYLIREEAKRRGLSYPVNQEELVTE